MSYLDTLTESLKHGRTLAIAAVVSLAYLGLFAYLGGIVSLVDGPQFVGVTAFPHFALNPDPALLLPHVGYQPTAGWYLEVNVIQAAELLLITGLVIVNVALSGLIVRIRVSARQTSSWLAGAAPFFVSNGACVACSGLPTGLAFLPASLASVAGGLLAMAQFYGIPALVTIVVLGLVGLYHLDRAAVARYRGPLA